MATEALDREDLASVVK